VGSETGFAGNSMTRRALLERAGRLSASVALTGAAAQFVGACGGGSSGGDIRMWSQAYADPEKFTGFVERLAADWSSDDGAVSWQIVPWTNAVQKWSLAMSNGSVPDVGDVFFLQARVVQGRGKWGPLDITEEVDDGMFGDFARFVPVARRESAYQDRIHGIPWRLDVRVLVYNDELIPTPPRTLDELVAIGEELVGANKVKAAGMTLDPSQPYQHLKMIGAMWGVEFLTDDLRHSNLEDERWLEACLWTQEAVRKKILLAEAATNMKLPGNDPLLNGSVAFQLGGYPSVLAQAEGAAPQLKDHLHSALIPVGPTGRSESIATSAHFSVFENTQSREDALAWLKHLTDPKVALDLVNVAGETSPDTTLQPEQTDEFRDAFFEASKTSLGLDQPSPIWAQLTAPPEGPFSKLTLDIFGLEDARRALKDAHEGAEALLRKGAQTVLKEGS
jgi:ABC-type glycerol-3-phosphate transport system substrate-binding protein